MLNSRIQAFPSRLHSNRQSSIANPKSAIGRRSPWTCRRQYRPDCIGTPAAHWCRYRRCSPLFPAGPSPPQISVSSATALPQPLRLGYLAAHPVRYSVPHIGPNLVAYRHELESAGDAGLPFLGLGVIHELGIQEVRGERRIAPLDRPASSDCMEDSMRIALRENASFIEMTTPSPRSFMRLQPHNG